MAQPVPSDVHVDTLLTNLSIAYRNAGYIAPEMFPDAPVGKQSDKLPAYNQSFWFRDDAKVRAPGTASTGGGFTVDTSATYFCNRYSRRFEVADELRSNADPVFANLDGDATEFVTDKLMMKREIQFATTFFTTSVWGTDVTGGTDFTQWSDYGGSNPVVDMDTWKDTVEAKIGIEPMKAAIGKQGWLQAKNHPALLDRIKYTQRAQVTADQAASLFEIDRLLIGRSIYTTTIEGTAEGSVTYTRIWGKALLLLYVTDRPSLLRPSAGYTFRWTPQDGGMGGGIVETYREDDRKSDRHEIQFAFQHKVVSAICGAFFSTVVS